jgi:predicted SprT family Zn-dependent metalloprotease
MQFVVQVIKHEVNYLFAAASMAEEGDAGESWKWIEVA